MPKGPKGEKRPADVIGNAVHVMRIATGEIQEGAPPDESRRIRGKKGATSRATILSAEERAEIARVAAEARWKRG